MSEIVSFGEFEIDELQFELRLRGQCVVVQPKVLRLLMLLVAQRHRSVTGAEILKVVWRDETVTSASIKRAIMGARTALGDRGQECIRTIRGHGYQFVMPVTTTSIAPPVPAPIAKSDPSLAQTAFVGREGMLTDLDTALAESIAGRGRCVLIVGEPGIGKSRTLREVTRRAAALGARPVLGRCMEFDGAPPFWPMLQILRELVHDRSPDALRSLLGPGASDIAEAFPELNHWLPELPVSPKIGSHHGRFRFFDSMATFLSRVAEEQPLVLLFDDLQQADVPTLRLLVFLVKLLDTSRVLMVGTARPIDQRESDVTAVMEELSRQDNVRRIELDGFPRGDVAHYLEALTGEPAPTTIVEQLYEQTAGNPLFLEEITRSLTCPTAKEDGPSRWKDISPLGASQGLPGAIERHLQTLSEPCRALLTTASVLGRDFSVGLLTPLADQPVREVHSLLSEAVTAGVAQATPNRIGQYRFTHALIRDVLYQRTPPLDRAHQHACAALCLEKRCADGDEAHLTVLTEHFMLAAPTHDGGRALHYARRAAAVAMRHFAYEEAAEYLRRALDLLEFGEPDTQQRMDLLLARGEALALGVEPAKAREVLLQTVSLGRALGAVDVVVRVATLLARPRGTGDADPVHIGLLREALALLPPADPRMPSLQALLAKSLSFTSEYSQRADLALGALRLTAELQDPELRAESLRACHDALTEPEHIHERVRITDELSRLAEDCGDRRLLLDAYAARVQNCVERGDMAGVDAAVSALEALAHQVREPFFRWYAKAFRAMRAIVAGDLTLAAEHAQEALQLGSVVGEDVAYHTYGMQMGSVLRLQGHITEAAALIRDISARHPGLAGWRAAVGCAEASLGRASSAREILAELMDRDLAKVRRDPFILSALCPLAELCVWVRDTASARVLYEALLPYEDHHGNVSFGLATHGPVALSLARLATGMKELAWARRHCEHAVAAAERMPSPTFTALSWIASAHMLMLDERPEARVSARQFLAQAEALSDKSGLKTLSAHCRVVVGGSSRPWPPR